MDFCDAKAVKTIPVALLLQQRQMFMSGMEFCNLISVAEYVNYQPIVALIYICSIVYQPIYVINGVSRPIGYFTRCGGFILVLLTFSYMITGALVLSFIYHKMSESTRQSLLDLINNVPDAVLLLEPRVTPPCLDGENDEEIQAGNIGVTFYDLLYFNEKTEEIFG